MDGTIRRLKEKRDKELAKSILESKSGIYDARQIRLAESKMREGTEAYSTPGDNDYVVYSDDSMNVEAQMFYSGSEQEILDFIKSNPRAQYVYDPGMSDGVALNVFDFLIDVIGMSPDEAGKLLDGVREGKNVNESDSWKSDSKGPYITHYREDYLTDAGEGPYIAEEDGEFTAFMGENDMRGKDFDSLDAAKKYIEQSKSKTEGKKVNEESGDSTGYWTISISAESNAPGTKYYDSSRSKVGREILSKVRKDDSNIQVENLGYDDITFIMYGDRQSAIDLGSELAEVVDPFPAEKGVSVTIAGPYEDEDAMEVFDDEEIIQIYQDGRVVARSTM